jgi:hypothetical protein
LIAPIRVPNVDSCSAPYGTSPMTAYVIRFADRSSAWTGSEGRTEVAPVASANGSR